MIPVIKAAVSPLTIKKEHLSLLLLLGSLVLYAGGLTTLVYPLSLAIFVLWVRTFSMKDVYLLAVLFAIVVVIFFANLFVVENFFDLTSKGILKLVLFSVSAVAYRNLFYSAIKHRLKLLRLVIWLAFIASLLIRTGFDLQSMQQMMIINLLFMVELYAFIRGDSRFLFYLAAFILIITTKKQLWFSAFVLLIFIRPGFLKKLTWVILGGLLFVAIFGAVGTKDYDITAEQRRSGFLSERFITPDPYGNMRLYLISRLIPELMENNILFGYGLERYGSISAYETTRDVESNVLEMEDFIGEEYNPESKFGSVAADVGFLTVLMQMGVMGLCFYLVLMIMLGRDIPMMGKGVAVLLPYFLGGPVVYSLGFPVLSGLVYAALIVCKQNQTEGKVIKRFRVA